MAQPDTVTPFLSSIGFSITARCPIACMHCIIEAGPHRKEEMLLAEGEQWLCQAAAYRRSHIKSVVFTGGEPFYNRTLLGGLLTQAHSVGLVPAVVTNAFWASTLVKARSMLQSLPRIAMLVISTDAYHQRFIPIQHVKNALLVAREFAIPHHVALCFQDEADDSYSRIREQLRTVVDDELVRLAATIPAGRAKSKLEWRNLTSAGEIPEGTCTAAEFPIVFPDGRLIGCMGIVSGLPMGHPLLFGNLREKPLAELLNKAETNTALHILRVWGPERLLRMLDENGWQGRLPQPCLKRGGCDLCYALTSDPQLLGALRELTGHHDIAEKTAYARLYYLQETAMLERLALPKARQGSRRPRVPKAGPTRLQSGGGNVSQGIPAAAPPHR